MIVIMLIIMITITIILLIVYYDGCSVYDINNYSNNNKIIKL
jgi:hypothetical protein